MEKYTNVAERKAQLHTIELDASNEDLIGLRQDALALAYDAVRGVDFPGFKIIQGDESGLSDLAVRFVRHKTSLLINHCDDGTVILTEKRRIEAEPKDQSFNTSTVCEVRCDGAAVTNDLSSYISPLSEHVPGQTIWDIDHWRNSVLSVRVVSAAERELQKQKRSKSWISRFAGRLATTKV